MKERREFTRLPVDTEVKVRSVSKETSNQGKSKNIGGGGILISLDSRYEAGTVLDIEVLTGVHKSFVHAFKPLRARIRVVRVDGSKPPYDIAGEFMEIEN
jgi:hypothetical protein